MTPLRMSVLLAVLVAAWIGWSRFMHEVGTFEDRGE